MKEEITISALSILCPRVKKAGPGRRAARTLPRCSIADKSGSSFQTFLCVFLNSKQSSSSIVSLTQSTYYLRH